MGPVADAVSPFGSADRRVVYISPHFDDAVWSSGGTIASLVRHGRTVEIVTVFAGRPDRSGPLGDAAREVHQRWKLAGTGRDVVEARAKENDAALGVLKVTPIDLEFLDVIYREPAIELRDILGAEPKSDVVNAVVDDLVARGIVNETSVVVIPRGLGEHVDHLVAGQAGAIAARKVGATLLAYAEFPYSSFAGGGIEIDEPGRWVAVDTPLPMTAVVRKVRSAFAYKSQVADLFGSRLGFVSSLLRSGSLRHEQTWRWQPG